MVNSLLLALGLMLVLEGVLPFLAPALWRQTLLDVLRLAGASQLPTLCNSTLRAGKRSLAISSTTSA